MSFSWEWILRFTALIVVDNGTIKSESEIAYNFDFCSKLFKWEVITFPSKLIANLISQNQLF